MVLKQTYNLAYEKQEQGDAYLKSQFEEAHEFLLTKVKELNGNHNPMFTKAVNVL